MSPCQCGCGASVRRAYAHGHNPHPRRIVPAVDRVLSRIVRADRGYLSPCWCWQGSRDGGGYGQVGETVGGRNYLRKTHRVVFQALKGDIPDGLHLDHLCEVKECVNPEHLEPVTSVENTRRHYERHPIGDVCSRGHPRSENTYQTPAGHTQCRACNRLAARKYQNKIRHRMEGTTR